MSILATQAALSKAQDLQTQQNMLVNFEQNKQQNIEREANRRLDAEQQHKRGMANNREEIARQMTTDAMTQSKNTTQQLSQAASA